MGCLRLAFRLLLLVLRRFGRTGLRLLFRTVLSSAVSGGPSVTNTAPLVIRAVDLSNPGVLAVNRSSFAILVTLRVGSCKLVVPTLTAVRSVTTVSFTVCGFELGFSNWTILDLVIWTTASEAIAVSSTTRRSWYQSLSRRLGDRSSISCKLV